MRASKAPAIFLPWEQLVAIDEPAKRHRLFAQGMDDVGVIDDLVMPSVGMAPPAGQRHQMRAADEDFEAIVEEAHAQPVSDQAGRHGVETLRKVKPPVRDTVTTTSSKSVVRRSGSSCK